MSEPIGIAPPWVRRPQQDPKGGDVFKIGHRTVTVEKKDGCVVRYRTSADPSNRPRYMNIETFRVFVANAEVIEEGK